MSLRVLHGSLAAVTAATGFALLASGAWAALRRSAPAIRLVVLVRQVTLVAAVLAAGVGLVLILPGQRPGQGLHFMYGAVAVGIVPVATSMAARQPRQGGLYHAGAGFVLLLMCFRLAATG